MEACMVGVVSVCVALCVGSVREREGERKESRRRKQLQ